MANRTGHIAFNLAATCASIVRLLAPVPRSRRTSGSLDDPSRFSTLSTHTEGMRAWAIIAFIGAAVVLAFLLAGRFLTTGDRSASALGAAICFGVADVGPGYATVAAFSRWVVLLLEERSVSRLYGDYGLRIAWGLVAVAFRPGQDDRFHPPDHLLGWQVRIASSGIAGTDAARPTSTRPPEMSVVTHPALIAGRRSDSGRS